MHNPQPPTAKTARTTRPPAAELWIIAAVSAVSTMTVILVGVMTFHVATGHHNALTDGARPHTVAMIPKDSYSKRESLSAALRSDIGIHDVRQFARVTGATNRGDYPTLGDTMTFVGPQNQAAACSLGAYVQDGSGRTYMLMAGHCVQPQWSYMLKETQFPSLSTGNGVDAGTVEVGDIHVRALNSVRIDGYGDTVITLDSVRQPYQGMPVCSLGQTTGWRCGRVVSVSDQGTFQTSFCSHGGDSGSVIMSGNAFVGITTISYGTDSGNTVCDTVDNGNPYSLKDGHAGSAGVTAGAALTYALPRDHLSLRTR